MQGGKKGLIINSTNLCAAANRAEAKFAGHNGKQASDRSVVGASCGKAKRHKKHRQ
jgi:hypothetical protein